MNTEMENPLERLDPLVFGEIASAPLADATRRVMHEQQTGAPALEPSYPSPTLHIHPTRSPHRPRTLPPLVPSHSPALTPRDSTTGTLAAARESWRPGEQARRTLSRWGPRPSAF